MKKGNDLFLYFWTMFKIQVFTKICFEILNFYGLAYYFFFFTICFGCILKFGMHISGCSLKEYLYGIDRTPAIHTVLKINTAPDDANSGYVNLIPFTISSTEIDQSALDLESGKVLFQDKPCCYERAFLVLESKFPVLKNKKNKFRLVYFGKCKIRSIIIKTFDSISVYCFSFRL